MEEDTVRTESGEVAGGIAVQAVSNNGSGHFGVAQNLEGGGGETSERQEDGAVLGSESRATRYNRSRRNENGHQAEEERPRRGWRFENAVIEDCFPGLHVFVGFEGTLEERRVHEAALRARILQVLAQLPQEEGETPARILSWFPTCFGKSATGRLLQKKLMRLSFPEAVAGKIWELCGGKAGGASEKRALPEGATRLWLDEHRAVLELVGVIKEACPERFAERPAQWMIPRSRDDYLEIEKRLKDAAFGPDQRRITAMYEVNNWGWKPSDDKRREYAPALDGVNFPKTGAANPSPPPPAVPSSSSPSYPPPGTDHPGNRAVAPPLRWLEFSGSGAKEDEKAAGAGRLECDLERELRTEYDRAKRCLRATTRKAYGLGFSRGLRQTDAGRELADLRRDLAKIKAKAKEMARENEKLLDQLGVLERAYRRKGRSNDGGKGVGGQSVASPRLERGNTFGPLEAEATAAEETRDDGPHHAASQQSSPGGRSSSTGQGGDGRKTELSTPSGRTPKRGRQASGGSAGGSGESRKHKKHAPDWFLMSLSPRARARLVEAYDAAHSPHSRSGDRQRRVRDSEVVELESEDSESDYTEDTGDSCEEEEDDGDGGVDAAKRC